MVRQLKKKRYFMSRIKRLYEFQCLKTGERWFREDREMKCPIRKDCDEDIKVIGYSIVDIVHTAEIKEVMDDTIYKSCGL